MQGLRQRRHSGRETAGANAKRIRDPHRLSPGGSAVHAGRIHPRCRPPGERGRHPETTPDGRRAGSLARPPGEIHVSQLHRRLRTPRPGCQATHRKGQGNGVELPHHHVWLQQALLRASGALLRQPLPAVGGRFIGPRHRLPLHPLPRAHQRRHPAQRRHHRLCSGNDPCRRRRPEVRLLRGPRHPPPLHCHAGRHQRPAATPKGSAGEPPSDRVQHQQLQHDGRRNTATYSRGVASGRDRLQSRPKAPGHRGFLAG